MNENSIINITAIDFHWDTSDPFLFCAYHSDLYPEGNAESGPAASLEGRNPGMDFEVRDGWRMYHGERVPGFPAHPHRGFETITIVQKGLVDHADSLGAAGRYGEGDVQWMTAGRGIQHSEMFPLVHQDQHNSLVLFQIWLNLPAARKLSEPHFAMYWANNIPQSRLVDDAGNEITINIIAGSIDDMQAPAPPPDSWAANPDNHIAIWTIILSPGASWVLPAAANNLSRSIYYYEGDSIHADGEKIESMHKLELQSGVEVMLQNGSAESRLLMLQGSPIDEPVAQYGPFVMNSNEELEQAVSDYQATHFGGWPWQDGEPVHQGRSRFAQHADGTLEEPD